MDEIIEIVSEFLFEFDNYESSGFDFLMEQKYNKLKKVYENTNDDVNSILKMVHDLTNSHAYSSLSGIGEEIIYRLEKIIDFLHSEGIQIPDIKKVQAHSFSERKGWGRTI